MSPSNHAFLPAHSQSAKRVLLITYPRTASNLFIKMLALENQPNVVSNESGGYFFWDAFMKERKTVSRCRPIEQWSPEETVEIRQAFQRNFDYFEAMSQSASYQGKIFFAKEHTMWLADPAAVAQYLSNHDCQASSRLSIQVPNSYGAAGKFSPKNITIFPDAYLETWTLTFLIRHPALVFPSYYRALLDLEKEGFAEPDIIQPMLELHSTLAWTRLLYDWYCEQVQSNPGQNNGICFPILLDAQDVIHHPEIVLKYCELMDMSPERVKFTWQPEMSPHFVNGAVHKSPEAVMMATLNRSTSLLKERTPDTVDITLERAKWEVEFGESLAKRMEKWVKDAMPDYNYLWTRRLRVI
ncbi:uncharacterized protein BJX67DRAFT_390278 [Aspergillus lucknowensis]|uniref:Sulfotransferase domain-containing protein n=1 Tax=Aspergillus lucknowensis TaxID=176173 RepID=A0ABR4LHG7_9EURO